MSLGQGAAHRPLVPKFAPADDYTTFCEAVRRLCGVDLLQYKRGQMERRIRTWTTRRGTPDLAAYSRVLQTQPEELDAFLDRVTINVSQLWRHPEHWKALQQSILPELAAAGPRVRAWSAGCSYGAEAYTLAAVCRMAIPDARVEIKGTDLDRRMVARAREGRFSAEDARGAPRDAIARYFPGGQATQELKRLVSFDVGDLLRMPVQAASFDLVMCRNTVIYFTEEVRDALHARLVDSLKPGGHLIVGTSERVADARGLGLSSPFHFIYRKDA
jgi:chemotaxis protein methyltransferase CheR